MRITDPSGDVQNSPPHDFKSSAQKLLREKATMTLATAHGDDPWAAPVYFVYRKGALYFFSDPGSRHITEALKTGRASAAVFEDSDSWREIKGLQMSGSVFRVHQGKEALEALVGYVRKFSFVKEFFKQGGEMNLAAFQQRFNVKLYCFKPRLIYYQDNSIKFGFRREVDLE